jgi:hypothetical protein
MLRGGIGRLRQHVGHRQDRTATSAPAPRASGIVLDQAVDDLFLGAA